MIERRREFITGLGGAAAWTLTARARQGERLYAKELIAHRAALAEVATVAKPDTILAWYRKLVAHKEAA